MSTQNHSGTFGASYMSRIASVVPTARAVKSVHTTRSKRHSPDDARKAVAEKLRANLAYLRDPDNNERPDLVYKLQLDGTYAVGVKYGNRWLSKLFDGDSYVQCGTAEQACELLELFATDAAAGEFDAFIKPIMDDNVRAGGRR